MRDQSLPVELPVEFVIDDRAYLLPELPTRRILTAIAAESPACWWNLVPAALDQDDAGRLLARLLDPRDAFDIEHLEQAAESVLGAVCGMPLYAAARLAADALGNWLLFDGHCTTHGFAPLREPISRTLAAVYAWRRGLCTKEQELAQLDAEIWAVPERTVIGKARNPVPPSWTEEREMAAFDDLMSTFGTPSR